MKSGRVRRTAAESLVSSIASLCNRASLNPSALRVRPSASAETTLAREQVRVSSTAAAPTRRGGVRTLAPAWSYAVALFASSESAACSRQRTRLRSATLGSPSGLERTGFGAGGEPRGKAVSSAPAASSAEIARSWPQNAARCSGAKLPHEQAAAALSRRPTAKPVCFAPQVHCRSCPQLHRLRLLRTRRSDAAQVGYGS